MYVEERVYKSNFNYNFNCLNINGELAQVVERSLSM